MQDIFDPVEVALVQRLVEADQFVKSFEVSRVLDAVAGDLGVEWPARREVQDAEQEPRGEHQSDRHFDGAADQEARHVLHACPRPAYASLMDTRRPTGELSASAQI